MMAIPTVEAVVLLTEALIDRVLPAGTLPGDTLALLVYGGGGGVAVGTDVLVGVAVGTAVLVAVGTAVLVGVAVEVATTENAAAEPFQITSGPHPGLKTATDTL